MQITDVNFPVRQRHRLAFLTFSGPVLAVGAGYVLDLFRRDQSAKRLNFMFVGHFWIIQELFRLIRACFK